MRPDTLVFSVEGERYDWRDIILSAVQRGDWQAVEKAAREGAACARHAEASRSPLDEKTVESAARDFRYAHDLLTARSMEDWLRRHELSVEDWSACLRSKLLRSRFATNVDDLVAQYPVSSADAAQLTLLEAICSGAIDTWARSLAERAAAHAFLTTTRANANATEASEPVGEVETYPLSILWGDDLETVQASARRLRRLDESLHEFRDALLTERAVREYLSAHQLDWVRFECRVMAFPNEGMAAEAALLLREDGEGFTSVYNVAHAPPRTAQFFLDQIADPMRSHFLGSREGDLIGPVHIDDQYVLYQIEEKVLPTIRDADVRRRAEDGVLANALGQQFERRVSWQNGDVKA